MTTDFVRVIQVEIRVTMLICGREGKITSGDDDRRYRPSAKSENSALFLPRSITFRPSGSSLEKAPIERIRTNSTMYPLRSISSVRVRITRSAPPPRSEGRIKVNFLLNIGLNVIQSHSRGPVLIINSQDG